MGMGYEGHVLFDTNTSLTGGIPLLCTSFSLPESRRRIDSSSLVGGRLTPESDGDGEEMISKPHAYDYPEYSGSLSVDITDDTFSAFKTWAISERNTSKVIAMAYNGATYQIADECFWNSISFETSEGSLVSSSVSFQSMSLDTSRIGNDYITNRTGTTQEGVGNFNTFFMENTTLNAGPNTSPIPFWNTSYTVSGVSIKPVSWSLNLSQPVELFYACNATSNPLSPRRVAIGPLEVTFESTIYLDNTSIIGDDYVPSEFYQIPTLTLQVGGNTITLSDLELTSYTPPDSGSGSIGTIGLSYSVYGISA